MKISTVLRDSVAVYKTIMQVLNNEIQDFLKQLSINLIY
jgi:hypothetical protein